MTCRGRTGLLVPFALYAGLVIPAFFLQWDQLHPDAVCYVRLARYLLAGDWHNATSGCWSPMLPWSTAGLMWLGMDGLHAVHLVLVIGGGLYVLALDGFLRSFTNLSSGWRCAVLSVMALASAGTAMPLATPDLLLASALLVYFALVTRRPVLERRTAALGVGMAGGVAYLAKAYAFPFFLVHFPLALYWSLQRHRRQLAESRGHTPFHGAPSWRQWRRAWIWGMSGFIVVSAPWVGALSWRFSRLTIASAGSINHAIVGPEDVPRQSPIDFGVPTPPHIYLLEVPEELTYRSWSPLHSWAYFRHQVDLIIGHLGDIFWQIASYSFLWLSLAALFLWPLTLWRLGQARADWWRLLWLGGTGLIYCSGFLAVHFEHRYVDFMLRPLVLIACLLLPLACLRGRWGKALATTILVSFAIPAAAEWLSLVNDPGTSGYRQVGQRLRELKCLGPVASSDWHQGLCLSFHADLPFAGFPVETDPSECNRMLHAYGIQTLLVWPKSWDDGPDSSEHVAEALVQMGTWRHRETITMSKEQTIEVYVPAGSDTQKAILAPPQP